MKKTQFSKMINKRSSISGVIPTMGPTADHTDGSWNKTDIYPGEFFYNLADDRLWVGGINGIVEIQLSEIFELTYAEAQSLKDINGSPAGSGLIIGAIYLITDKGDSGLILKAIDVDKFSFYADELIGSPVGQRACIYDFDNDLLSYPAGANYKIYTALLTQTGTSDPVASVLEDDILGGIWTRVPTVLGPLGQFDYKFTPTVAFDADKTFCPAVGDAITGASFGTYIDNFNQNDNCLYIRQVADDTFYNTPIEIRVYN